MKTSVATTSMLGLSQVAGLAADANNADNRQYYELRAYTFKPGASHKLVEDYLSQALIPALNRLGSTPIGVFTELDKPNSDALYVLIPYSSLDPFITTATHLATDNDYQKAAADYLNVPATAPAYDRMETALMHAFAGMPQLVLPPMSADKKPRIFELRTYESHNEKAALKKIEMFNTAEIGIMRRVGLGPVFYGQTIIGPKMPNLTYMLSGEDKAAHQKHWGAFGGDAEWKRVHVLPEYLDANIVSHISNKFLSPTLYSQI